MTQEKTFVATLGYSAKNENELSLGVGDVVHVLDQSPEHSGWWYGHAAADAGLAGWFPAVNLRRSFDATPPSDDDEDENVRAMTVVTPSGRVIRTRRAVRKSSTGYELNALYLGAEGTLGVITEVTVRTFPIPKVRCGAVVSFETVADAARTTVRATEANLETMLRCELMNDEGIRCTNAVFGTRLAERPTLFLEFSSDDRRRCVREWREVRAIAIDPHPHRCAATIGQIGLGQPCAARDLVPPRVARHQKLALDFNRHG